MQRKAFIRSKNRSPVDLESLASSESRAAAQAAVMAGSELTLAHP
ncbi:hypothetical protein [Variovorax sp. EL159]|nr:hypothetical protein [Variovorax sp. EL159]SCX41008.1 hypothetical protein SAMN03159363_0386 [Variovorax sp. EL159]